MYITHCAYMNVHVRTRIFTPFSDIHLILNLVHASTSFRSDYILFINYSHSIYIYNLHAYVCVCACLYLLTNPTYPTYMYIQCMYMYVCECICDKCIYEHVHVQVTCISYVHVIYCIITSAMQGICGASLSDVVVLYMK